MPQYEDLPEGVLGFTKFTKKGVEAIVIAAALDAEKGKVAERRLRTTLAHEAGHGLLHAYLFALDEKPLHLFDADSHADHKILCRDVQGEERKSRVLRWPLVGVSGEPSDGRPFVPPDTCAGGAEALSGAQRLVGRGDSR